MNSLQDVYVLGLASHPATLREDKLRLEEMVYHTSRRALEEARVSRRQLETVVIGACDEFDGRPISSMLMAAPAGGYLTDEIKVTDSGAMALCLGYARVRSSDFQIGLVASWCKSSKTDMADVMRFRDDPFFVRPLGIDATVGDALFAQAVGKRFRIDAEELTQRARRAYARGAKNERGLCTKVPSETDIAASDYLAWPLRALHLPKLSDGCVSLVIASAKFLGANPQCKPLARITGAGWSSDSYRLDSERLSSFASLKQSWRMALAGAGLRSAADFDVIELESPTPWHEAAYVRELGIEDESVVSPSGGAYAQYPYFCSGLINAAEAVLQVAGAAGPVQRPDVRNAVAHSCHGIAQQGNVFVTFAKAEVSDAR